MLMFVDKTALEHRSLGFCFPHFLMEKEATKIQPRLCWTGARRGRAQTATPGCTSHGRVPCRCPPIGVMSHKTSLQPCSPIPCTSQCLVLMASSLPSCHPPHPPLPPREEFCTSSRSHTPGSRHLGEQLPRGKLSRLLTYPCAVKGTAVSGSRFYSSCLVQPLPVAHPQ